MHTRTQFASTLIAVLIASACSRTASNPAPPASVRSSTSTSPLPPSSTAPKVVALPDSPAGKQLAWVIDGLSTATDAEITARFSKPFIDQVGITEVRTVRIGFGTIVVTEILSSQPTSAVVRTNTDAGPLILTISVDGASPPVITGLLAEPAPGPTPTSWTEVETRLQALGADTGYLVATVAADGRPTPLHARNPAVAGPLGSSFKLYVLGALARAIAAGSVAWTDTVTITPELKSLPSGELQDRPDGSGVSVLEAATLMISISDNTATDMLIDLVGVDAVEAVLATMGMSKPSVERNTPWLTTRQLFTLKWGGGLAELDRYIAADDNGRRAILAALPVDGLASSAKNLDPAVPVAIGDVEWFASREELASAHIWLDGQAEQPGLSELRTILGTNPGVGIDPALWSRFAFKGGSEPGVLSLTWLLGRPDGTRFVVAVLANDPKTAINETEGAAIGQGVINLLADKP